MPSRIAIILPDLRVGGGQRVLLGLARQFVEYGQLVDIVAAFDDGEFVSELPFKANYRRLLPKCGDATIWRSMKALFALILYLRQAKPDVVLSSMTGTNLLTATACLLARDHSRLLLREAASFVNLRSRFFPFLIRILYRRANAVIAVSAGVAEDLAGVGLDKRKIHVIHNPIDVERLRAMASEAAASVDELETPYIVSIGRLVAQKDHETLLRAYALSQAVHRYRLVIVGDGELRAQLYSVSKVLGVNHRIAWVGALSNPYGVLSKASLLVLSSRWEGYPNVLLEAVALGVPVVSTDCPAGPREMLKGGRFGRLASVGDHQGLARAMDEELNEPSAGREDILRAHQMEVVAKRYLSSMDVQNMSST
jgi:glycosyltransferase involved in cell wall biosynthesis